jgi:hypothetical protein
MFYIVPVFLLLVNCTSNSDDSSKKKELTKDQRDSMLAESRLPGAKAVKKAIAVSDSAAAKKKKLDDLSDE